ncbi:hypothetical protein QKG93_14635 [Clavibacter michiganensis]|uniref:hypothetical protein n=1 Tax=Clavibacter michiganensis TaxID=28447 RepID=UPI0026DA8E3A|nr:hypothetical protein [Clavibacter michiganensis]MDO4027171.1 hypothetical protein [Clavibacter michiganensis]MDO4135177.1 hypothetical protein [Clavibacter michiganensis]
MTYITYERPRRLHDRELDPFAPDADLSPTGETCGETTYDVVGNLWTCTRRPHTESEHRAAYEYRAEGPQGEVAIAWESNWGEPAARPTTTTAITTTITHPTAVRQCSVSADDLDRIEHPVWETFVPDDYDALTITTTVAEAAAAAAALARLVDVLSADELSGSLAAALDCTAADAIAGVLRTQGAAGAAHRWIRDHSQQDKPGDVHHSPAPDGTR